MARCLISIRLETKNFAESREVFQTTARRSINNILVKMLSQRSFERQLPGLNLN